MSGFAEKGIDIADMGVNDYATMSKEIYETVTGFEASIGDACSTCCYDTYLK